MNVCSKFTANLIELTALLNQGPQLTGDPMVSSFAPTILQAICTRYENAAQPPNHPPPPPLNDQDNPSIMSQDSAFFLSSQLWEIVDQAVQSRLKPEEPVCDIEAPSFNLNLELGVGRPSAPQDQPSSSLSPILSLADIFKDHDDIHVDKLFHTTKPNTDPPMG